MTAYYVCDYDNEASGPFVEEGANITWPGGGIGFLVTLVDRGLTGKLYFGVLAGGYPTDGEQIAQGGVTADAVGDAAIIDYPAYARRDVDLVAGVLGLDASAEALGTTHTFKFDGQTGNVTAADILTFSPGGETAEVIAVISDAGATGELGVRMISPVDVSLPGDGDTFTNGASGDGAIDGLVHQRIYKPYHIHRLLADLNDDEDISGDDDLSRMDPTPSAKDTGDIIRLIGGITTTAALVQRMYAGSISMNDGDDLFGGLDVQVTSPNADTEPVLIQNDAIITSYWGNAYMPDSIAGNVRILTLIRQNGVDIDGRRIKGKLLEYGHIYFIGGTTLGTGKAALALFSSADGNNDTSVGFVAGAPYNTVVPTEGYQTIDYNNGNGLTPYALSYDFGSCTISKELYERTKYIQRRGTSEVMFGGRDATYFDGINLNFVYDTLTGSFSEDEIVYWGTELTFTGQGATSFTVGEEVSFSGGTVGRLLYQNDAGATGTCIFDFGGNALPLTTETMTGLTSGGDGTVATIGTNTAAGSGWLIAEDTSGLNMYISRLTGVLPVNNSEIYGGTSNADCLVAGTPEFRTINNQFLGVFTGANVQSNYGIAIDSTDAILNDALVNLLGVSQGPPDNRTGAVTDCKAYDTVMMFPWDGASTDVNGNPEPNFDEMALATALVAGVSTQVDVGAGNIPDNTPQVGGVRVVRDSDDNYDLIPYDSHDGDRYFEIVGTAPSAAAISNFAMRSLLEEERTSDGTSSYSAVYVSAGEQVVIIVRNGYTALKNGPIKEFITTATFGAFAVKANRASDA